MKNRHGTGKGKKAPSIVNGTVPPRRRREHLTEREVERLIAVAKKRGRYGLRDAAMILVAYRHGLRVGELCRRAWDQIDFASGVVHVRRAKIPAWRAILQRARLSSERTPKCVP